MKGNEVRTLNSPAAPCVDNVQLLLPLHSFGNYGILGKSQGKEPSLVTESIHLEMRENCLHI